MDTFLYQSFVSLLKHVVDTNRDDLCQWLSVTIDAMLNAL